jgi:selT/selW/selH-like putative selenoprotein
VTAEDPSSTRHRLEIEFCQACKFGGRAFFLARELFDQRPDLVDEIVLVPSSGGAFTVRFDGDVVWDYKERGGFPEPKQIREAILALRAEPPTPPRHG